MLHGRRSERVEGLTRGALEGGFGAALAIARAAGRCVRRRICMTETTNMSDVVICGATKPGYETVLTPEAVAFAAELERKFGAQRRRLLARRAELQERLDSGWK